MSPSSRIVALPLVAASLLPVGCGEAPTETGGGASRVAPSDEGSTEPTPTGTARKGDIYGADQRREASSVERDSLRDVVRRTAALVDASRVRRTNTGTTTLQSETYRETNDLCREERFADQPVPAFCTAFLIAPDRVATAGHCVASEQACASTRIAFGFEHSTTVSEEGEVTLPTRDVYGCETIVDRRRQPASVDYAVLQLDREVVDRHPLAVRTHAPPPPGRPLAIVGHPMGLPMKVGLGGEVRASSTPELVQYALDTYGGHSGSPVVDPATGIVQALHTRGTRDFTRREDRDCRVSRVCRDVEEVGACSGNSGTAATVLAPWATRSAAETVHPAGDRIVRTPDGRLRAKIRVPPPEGRAAVTLRVEGHARHPSAPTFRIHPPNAAEPTVVEAVSADGRFSRAIAISTRPTGGWEGTWRILVEGRRLRGLELERVAIALRETP